MWRRAWFGIGSGAACVLAISCCMAMTCGCGGPVNDAAALDHELTVVFDWPGASVENVELLVAAPVEHVFGTLAGVSSVDSVSRDGQCVISVAVASDADVERVKSSIAKALDDVRSFLPDAVETPQLTSIPDEALPGTWLVLTSDGLSELELSMLATDVRSRVERIAGVAEVRSFGWRQPGVHVRLDPDKLIAYGVSAKDCIRAVSPELLRKLAAQSELGRTSVEDLGNMTVATREDLPVRLSDVAEFRVDAGVPESFAHLDGDNCIALGVFAANDASAARERLLKELAAIRRTLPGDVSLQAIPESDEKAAAGGLLVEALAPPGLDDETAHRVAAQIELDLLRKTSSQTLAIWTRNASTIRILLRPSAGASIESQRDVVFELTIPGLLVRTAKMPAGAGMWRPDFGRTIMLTGPERERLAEWSAQLERQLAETKLEELTKESDDVLPRKSIQLRPARLAEAGLTAEEVQTMAALADAGIGLPIEGKTPREIRFFLTPDARELTAIRMPTERGMIPLADVAEVTITAGPATLRQHNGRRTVRLFAKPTAAEADFEKRVANMAREIAKELRLSDEYQVEIK